MPKIIYTENREGGVDIMLTKWTFWDAVQEGIAAHKDLNIFCLGVITGTLLMLIVFLLTLP